MTKSIQLILDCNEKAAVIGQAIALQLQSDDPSVKERARVKMLHMLDMHMGMTEEVMVMLKEGITYDKWLEMFQRWNSKENCVKIDNAQGELRKLYETIWAEGDLEGYYVQHVLPIKIEDSVWEAAKAGLVMMRDALSVVEVK